MRTSRLISTGFALFSFFSVPLFGDDTVDRHGLAFFEKRIRPVLVERCYQCHSIDGKNGEPVKGGLRLDSRAALRRGGDSGVVIVPGDVEASRLISAIRHQDLEMPPDGKLSDHVIADFVKWIEIGAPDPRDDERRKASRIDVEAAREYWAFRPLQVTRPPNTDSRSSGQNEIDRYVSARRAEQAIAPNPPADRYALLRRVFIDLTGLVPEPESIVAFVNDDSPDAYEKVVDRLLTSPRFGERWARHWLDVAQYADSLDIERIFPNDGAWRYRDYVIRALNHDRPFDRFIVEQIAGDLLPFEGDAQRAEQIVATQFLTQLPMNLVNQFKEQLRMDLVDGQVDKIGRVFLGMTFGCARCHDHKFDPLGQLDYYALAGIFQNVQILKGKRGTSGVFSDWTRQPIPETPDEKADRDRRTASHQLVTERLETELEAAKSKRDALQAELQTIASGTDSQAKEKEITREIEKINGGVKKLETEIDDHVKANTPEPPVVLAASEPARSTNARVTIRGNALQLGEEVPRGLPRVIAAAEDIPDGASGRLQLARSLVHRDNSIVPRVFVNRVWHHLFGTGIVSTPDNFGARGQKPTHPGLLDFLAHRFVTNGWRVKPLIRDIVLTQSYRLSSDLNSLAWSVDPDNRLLWRHTPRRLDAESLRDSVLRISGSLSSVSGGPTLPAGRWNDEAFAQFAEVSGASTVRPDVLEGRSIYLPISRGISKFTTRETLAQFDFPSPNEITGSRMSSIVPTQSLFLLNSPFVSTEAGKFAERLLTQDLEPQDCIGKIYLWAYGRPARPEEIAQGLEFLNPADSASGDESESETAETSSKANTGPSDLARLCHTVLISTEFLMHD